MNGNRFYFRKEISVDWFLYDNGLRHERVKIKIYFKVIKKLDLQNSLLS